MRRGTKKRFDEALDFRVNIYAFMLNLTYELI